MEDRLVSVLEGIELSQDYDVILQGTLSECDYEPENFFSYWCWDNIRDSFYNNERSRNLLGYQITGYSTDRTFLSEMMEKAVEELEKNDFIIEDDITDIASDNKAYTAKMIEVYFIKKKEE